MIDRLKICSMNVRGLADKKKRKDMFTWLKEKNCSVYCLQDVHSSNLLENNFKLEWGYECIFNSYTSESRGVFVLINKKC